MKTDSNVSDIILVAVGFYVGDEKGNGGRLPFVILGAIAAGTMILSEVIILRYIYKLCVGLNFGAFKTDHRWLHG